MPPDQSTTRWTPPRARRRDRGRELAREPRQPRAERERLDAAAGAPGGVQVEEQRARVGSIEPETSRIRTSLRGARTRLRNARVERVAAGRERPADEAAHVEHVPSGSRAQAARAPPRPVRAIARISRARAGELLGLIAAKSRVRRAPRRSSRRPRLAALELGPGAGRGARGAGRPRRRLSPRGGGSPRRAGTRHRRRGRRPRGPRAARRASAGASSRRRRGG